MGRKPRGPTVKTADFDSANPGSNPGAVASEATTEQLIAEHNKLDAWLKAETKSPRAMKVDPMLIFGACVGMGLDDVPVVASIMETLQKLPKKSRGRVIAALAKIFA